MDPSDFYGVLFFTFYPYHCLLPTQQTPVRCFGSQNTEKGIYGVPWTNNLLSVSTRSSLAYQGNEN